MKAIQNVFYKLRKYIWNHINNIWNPKKTLQAHDNYIYIYIYESKLEEFHSNTQ